MATIQTAQYKITDGSLGFPDTYVSNDPTQRTNLGKLVQANDRSSNDYGDADLLYVKFTGAVARGDFVIYDRFNKTGLQSPVAAANAKAFSAGIAMAAQAAGSFGWIMIRGIHDGANILNGTAVGSLLSGSGVAGQASQGVANYNLDPTRCVQAPVNNIGIAELGWPSCSGR